MASVGDRGKVVGQGVLRGKVGRSRITPGTSPAQIP